MSDTSRPAVLAPPQRLGSLDAYRGLVMIALASRGFGIAATAKNFPDSVWWQKLGYQFSHVEWVGCTFWDMIQPSFMFMVGVSLPFSFAGRAALGYSSWQLWIQACIRAAVLIFLGIFLRSQRGTIPNFTFMDVLTQIGLGYVFLFAMWRRPVWLQLIVAQVILIGYGAWFAMSPVPDLDLATVGVTEAWQQEHGLTGFAAHWQKNANPAARFDQWFLNQFPQEKPFEFNDGGYATLNFIPALVTMLFGLMTGEAIRNAHSKGNVVVGLLICGLLGLASGWALHYFGVCPLVKRLWTPSWTLFSTGWCWLILAGFYWIIDVCDLRAWSFPLRVAGMNSVVLYLLGQLLPGWTQTNLQRFFGEHVFTFNNANLTPYEPLIRCNLVLLCFWLFVYWLYRQKIFVRI